MIKTRRLVRQLYFMDGDFNLDLLVGIPFVVQLLVSVKGESSPVERLTRLLRLLRVFRLVGVRLTTPEILFHQDFPDDSDDCLLFSNGRGIRAFNQFRGVLVDLRRDPRRP